MSQISPETHESTQSQVMGLTLVQLKAVARNDRIAVSGPKAILQTRIKDKLSEYVRRLDIQNFFRLKSLIEHPDQPPPSSTAIGTAQHPSTSLSGYPSVNSHPKPSVPLSVPLLKWKRSPFYEILESLTPLQECKVRETTRDSFDCKIRITSDIVEKFSHQKAGEDLRILIYCTAEPISAFTESEIAFPRSIELKVNDNELKANLQGLKNKPGSTRPADITDMIHKKPNYTNILTVTYALTHKKFYLVVNLVNKIPADDLVKQMQSRPRISKDQVLREMAAKAQDTEIQATSTIMSLKCPLSTSRMDVPCRSTHCIHNQCYDALSFLQLQEQGPTWTCPICNKPARYETLHIDGYVSEILHSSLKSVEQVAIEPNGDWKAVSTDGQTGRAPTSGSDEADDDDDLVEIQEPLRTAPPKSALANHYPSMTRTPPHSSREQSITSASVRSSGSKRPASAVIDLTFSSDEDELPRPTKRQSHYYSNSEAAHLQSIGQQNLTSGRNEGVSFPLHRKDDYSTASHYNPLMQ